MLYTICPTGIETADSAVTVLDRQAYYASCFSLESRPYLAAFQAEGHHQSRVTISIFRFVDKQKKNAVKLFAAVCIDIRSRDDISFVCSFCQFNWLLLVSLSRLDSVKFCFKDMLEMQFDENKMKLK